MKVYTGVAKIELFLEFEVSAPDLSEAINAVNQAVGSQNINVTVEAESVSNDKTSVRFTSERFIPSSSKITDLQEENV